MTTIYINTNDQNKIQEFVSLAVHKFHFEIQVEHSVENKPQRQFKSLSSSLDKQIRNAKSTNTKKADKLKKTMETLNSLMSSKAKNMTLKEAKEQYFISKNNQI